METYYKIINDGTYSHIEVEPELIKVSEWDNKSLYYNGTEVFKTFTSAKNELLTYLQDIRDNYNYAIKELRKYKKSDLTHN